MLVECMNKEPIDSEPGLHLKSTFMTQTQNNVQISKSY